MSSRSDPSAASEPRCHRCGGRLPLEGEPYDKRVTDYCCTACAAKVVDAANAAYGQRLAEVQSARTEALVLTVRRAVMLSMSLTGTLKHFDGSDAWTHDDYDIAQAALNELARRANGNA